jgi:hypothetical protein
MDLLLMVILLFGPPQLGSQVVAVTEGEILCRGGICSNVVVNRAGLHGPNNSVSINDPIASVRGQFRKSNTRSVVLHNASV